MEPTRRVLLVDDSDDGPPPILSALERTGATVVLGRSLDDLQCTGVDLALFDGPRHGDAGRDAVARCAGHTRIAILTGARNIDDAIDFFRLGVVGFLTTDAPLSQMASDLDHLLDGRTVIDATLGAELAHVVARTPGLTWPGMAHGLTPREGEVFRLLQRGMTNREIADRLIIGLQTVKTHAHVIYRKLGVSSRTDLLV